jgi:20S proteasome subunit beta 3
MLYKRRFGPYFISPLVAGLDPITGEAFISSTDMIGSITEPRDFVTIGTGEEYALACCESGYQIQLLSYKYSRAQAFGART